MAFTVPEQTKHLIGKSSHILIAFRMDPTADSIATSIALALYLKKLGKNVEVASADFVMPKKLAFLPSANIVRPAISNAQKTVLKVDITNTGLESLAYDIEQNQKKTLKIFVTPKSGALKAGDVRFSNLNFHYDLVFIIDTQDLESLGKLYSENTDLFFQTPIITIDNDPSNEHFGQINLVELTATSAAEVLYHTLVALNDMNGSIDKDMATCILTGMIAETKSFKTPQVTPHTLSIASRLIDLGANREEIVEYLYRTKSISALKLWGRALSRMEGESTLGFVWTAVTKDDFVHAGASEHDLPELVHELINTTPDARVSAVFYECPGPADAGKVCALVSSERQFDARHLTKPFEPTGSRNFVRLEFKDKSINEVRDLVTQNIKKILSTAKY